MKRTFEKKFLVEELDLPYSAIVDNITDTSRWSVYHEIIFEYEGKFWQTNYSCGATEMQYESPWENDDQIKCKEVHKVQKMVEVWECVE